MCGWPRWHGTKPPIGPETVAVTPPSHYILYCHNNSGSSYSTIWMDQGWGSPSLPSVSLWADRYVLHSGVTTMIRWQTENVNSEFCTASGSGWSGNKSSGSGQELIGPLLSTKEYILSCSNHGGERIVKIKVGVGGVAEDIQLDFLSSDYDLSAGESAELKWEATGSVSECYVTGTETPDWMGSKWFNSSAWVSPEKTTIYELTCEGPRGLVTKKVKIIVAKVLVCPENPIVTKNTNFDLTAWYKQDADENFTCGDTTDAVDVTNGYTEGMIPDKNTI